MITTSLFDGNADIIKRSHHQLSLLHTYIHTCMHECMYALKLMNSPI